MAKRTFRLPGEEELNKDQDSVLALPEDGQFLVVGGPGIGKSVVALLRAVKYHKPGGYVFLTFNKVLNESTRQLVDGFELRSRTIHSWFVKLYQRYFKTNALPPEHQPWRYHYDKIIQDINNTTPQANAFHVIIDEGQDMPVKFYETLIEFGLENLFVVADQNQQMTDENSTRQELTDVLGLDPDAVIELKINYRNTRQIAALASYFHIDPASPTQQIPDQRSLETPTLYEYGHRHDCARMILREADKDNSKLIGLIVANNSVRKNYVDALVSIDIGLDHPRAPIATYPDLDSTGVNIVFSEAGIVILNAASVKGLEFDTVFIDLNGFRIVNNDIESMKKKLYVLTSRAIDKLVILKNQTDCGGVDRLLPNDASLLQRKKLEYSHQKRVDDPVDDGFDDDLPF